MPKVDFSMIVHNGQPFLELNLQAIYPLANRIIIIEGPVALYRQMGFGKSDDGTLETIAAFPDPERKIFFESGLSWDEKDSMVRAQEKWFSGDWIWSVDADEFYHVSDMLKVFQWLDAHPECYSMSFRLFSFFGGFDRTIGGFEASFETHRLFRLSPGARWLTHRPPTLLWAPTGKTCREMGHVDGTATLDVRIHHYSHLPPKRMKHKALYYQKYSSSIIADYFPNLYIPWLAAKTDAERMAVENRYRGVQEFRPECRTEAYTVPFVGRHPYVIEQAKLRLEQQIRDECTALGIVLGR
jgi:hypothetical protein